MRSIQTMLVVAIGLTLALPLQAQRNKRDPLTGPQIEKIREAGDDPPGRVKLYAEFMQDHVDVVKEYGAKGHSPSRAKRLDDELQDVAALADEFGSNLDVFDERKADIRKALKDLNEAIPKWQEVLNTLKVESTYELSRTDALASLKDLSDQAQEMLKDQTKYFDEHPEQKGQERYEPKN